jgi:hypothetical protein
VEEVGQEVAANTTSAQATNDGKDTDSTVVIITVMAVVICMAVMIGVAAPDRTGQRRIP